MKNDALKHTPQRENEAITHWLLQWKSGDTEAFDRLVALIKPELSKIAKSCLNKELHHRPQTTNDLIQEFYLRLIDVHQLRAEDRAHFFSLAASVMRRILVDWARKRNYQKREGEKHRVSLDAALTISPKHSQQLPALDEALVRLSRFDPRQSQIVELRYFGGRTIEETAEVMKISVATVNREWSTARAWLKRELEN